MINIFYNDRFGNNTNASEVCLRRTMIGPGENKKDYLLNEIYEVLNNKVQCRTNTDEGALSCYACCFFA